MTDIETIIKDLEFSAYNLCDDPDRDASSIVESTCPETTLLVAIWKLKELVKLEKEG